MNVDDVFNYLIESPISRSDSKEENKKDLNKNDNVKNINIGETISNNISKENNNNSEMNKNKKIITNNIIDEKLTNNKTYIKKPKLNIIQNKDYNKSLKKIESLDKESNNNQYRPQYKSPFLNKTRFNLNRALKFREEPEENQLSKTPIMIKDKNLKNSKKDKNEKELKNREENIKYKNRKKIDSGNKSSNNENEDINKKDGEYNMYIK